MGNEILAAAVGAALGAAGGWATQWAMAKASVRTVQADGLQAKLHDHEVRISVLEAKADMPDHRRR